MEDPICRIIVLSKQSQSHQLFNPSSPFHLQVLKEVANSGILCDYVSMGNRVVLIVEFHNMSITDGDERRREKDGSAQARKKLETCGVEFGNLHAHWK